MSCECNINLVKEIENKYSQNVQIFRLQRACTKCGCYFESSKKGEKGVGFATWAKNLLSKKDREIEREIELNFKK